MLAFCSPARPEHKLVWNISSHSTRLSLPRRVVAFVLLALIIVLMSRLLPSLLSLPLVFAASRGLTLPKLLNPKLIISSVSALAQQPIRNKELQKGILGGAVESGGTVTKSDV
jgi:hypothetical protein